MWARLNSLTIAQPSGAVCCYGPELQIKCRMGKQDNKSHNRNTIGDNKFHGTCAHWFHKWVYVALSLLKIACLILVWFVKNFSPRIWKLPCWTQLWHSPGAEYNSRDSANDFVDNFQLESGFCYKIDIKLQSFLQDRVKYKCQPLLMKYFFWVKCNCVYILLLSEHQN